jgi:hypothetical protein
MHLYVFLFYGTHHFHSAGSSGSQLDDSGFVEPE